MQTSLIEVYLEIGKGNKSDNRTELIKVPNSYGADDPAKEMLVKRLTEFSFPTPNPQARGSDSHQATAVQYTYVLQETVPIKTADCDVTTLSHYVFCLQTARQEDSLTHCISSQYPYFRSFYKILSVISNAAKEGKEHAIEQLILAMAKETRIPSPGNPITIHLGAHMGLPPITIEHESPFVLPLMYENDHIAEFYRAFGLLQSLESSARKESSTLVRIFAHLLMERRFLVTSNEVRRFTSCCYALQSIIYPLEWNYVYVPLLFPNPDLLKMPALPQPYIMGVHKSNLEEALSMADSPDDCAIVLDVDTGQISSHYAEDVFILPKEVRLLMESRLANAEMIARKGDYFARIFMDALVLMIGDYQQCFTASNLNGQVEFSWQKYQSYRPERDYQSFAVAVESKLGMIKMFLLQRLEMFRQGRPLPADDFEMSLRDRNLLVKEVRSQTAMQQKFKKEAGKLFSNVKNRLGGNKLPPRSQSRPIMEQSPSMSHFYSDQNSTLAVNSSALRRPLSQEDVSIYRTVELKVDLPALKAEQPPPLPKREPVVQKIPEKDLMRLDSSDDEEVSRISVRRSLPPEMLAKADPLTLFDPLETTSSLDLSSTKSRSSSLQNKQQKEMIDRVLSLYAIPPNQPTTVTFPAMPQPAFPGYAAQSLHYRQSTLFPGRIPMAQFQQPPQPSPVNQMGSSHFYMQSPPQQQQQKQQNFFAVSSTLPSNSSSSTMKPQPPPVPPKPAHWTTFD